jgi:hypothetical protein
MSQELKQLADGFNRYFTSANSVDVGERVTVSRDEWRTLYAALARTHQPEAAPQVVREWPKLTPEQAQEQERNRRELWGMLHGSPEPLAQQSTPVVPEGFVLVKNSVLVDVGRLSSWP